MRMLYRAAGPLIAALVAGCAGVTFPGGFDFAPGTPREAVVAKAGAPQRVVRIPEGERLQYSLQPVGQFAWMVDVDASGKVIRSRQVLTDADFQRIQPGWTREDVEREFGRPGFIDGVASWDGPIMTYRWRDTQGSDMFYWVYLDRSGIVRRAHPGMEFVNAPNDRN